jgi:hypothetical protein
MARLDAGYRPITTTPLDRSDPDAIINLGTRIEAALAELTVEEQAKAVPVLSSTSTTPVTRLLVYPTGTCSIGIRRSGGRAHRPGEWDTLPRRSGPVSSISPPATRERTRVTTGGPQNRPTNLRPQDRLAGAVTHHVTSTRNGSTGARQMARVVSPIGQQFVGLRLKLTDIVDTGISSHYGDHLCQIRTLSSIVRPNAG